MSNSSTFGITFNGKHTYRDLGLIITSKTIGMPERTPILMRPPYSNVPIDLSNLYGHTVYGDRSYKLEFLLRDPNSYSKPALAAKLTAVLNWVEGAMGRQPLIDDVEPEYYYLAEPIKAPTWNELLTCGKFAVEWTCNPYRVAVAAEGDDRWNPFNFEMGVSQAVSYNVVGSQSFILINPSSELVQPTITTNAPMTITLNNEAPIDLVAGITTALNQAYPVSLLLGANYITVSGTGMIAFEWHREVI